MKTTFVLFFGTRGTFPSYLIQQAREEMSNTLGNMGYGVIMQDADATPTGAVDTPKEGKNFADFLKIHSGSYQGVILCLPNFGSEGGVIEALKNVQVPVFIHAYPDELDKLSTKNRRDAFCGKFAILNILCQYGLKFTNLKPHVVHPSDPLFKENIKHFEKVCKIVHTVKNLTVGAIGARTTTFKAVRYDEIALQKHGITVETIDLTNVFDKIEAGKTNQEKIISKKERLKEIGDWKNVPGKAIEKLTGMGVAIDQIVEEYKLDALALRCWSEIQKAYGISPCVLMSEMNDRGLIAACEMDVCSAVAMSVLHAATGTAVANLDWNNNYEKEEDKCILFHCGPVPSSLMAEKGRIADNELLVSTMGEGRSWGCHVGRIKPMNITYCGLKTTDGKLQFYIGEGEITNDYIPDNFFGCAGVAKIKNLQTVLNRIGTEGHRHHTVITEGHVADAVHEALEKYIGAEVIKFND